MNRWKWPNEDERLVERIDIRIETHGKIVNKLRSRIRATCAPKQNDSYYCGSIGTCGGWMMLPGEIQVALYSMSTTSVCTTHLSWFQTHA